MTAVRSARLPALLALLLVGLGGCHGAAAPPVAASPHPVPAPADSVPAPIDSGAAPIDSVPAPTEAGPAPTGAAERRIGTVPPGGARVAGADLGRAEPLAPATIAAFPEPAGPGAVPRGTRPVVVSHGPRDRKRIALTFDSNMTDAMLRRLAAHRVRSYASPAVVDELQRSGTPATFFLAGKWAEAYPGLTRRIAADPRFELASHSWSHEGFRAHCYALGQIPPAAMAADVERSFQVLGRFAGRQTRYFRFPGGCYDPAALAAIAPAGCTVVEYDDVSGDAFGTSPRAIEDDTVRQARPGSIVVLHITGDNARHTGAALPGIIRRLRAAGYQLVTLGDLLSPRR